MPMSYMPRPLVCLTRISACIAGLWFLLSSGYALAHPHVLVSAQGDVVFNTNGEVKAVNYRWRFDEQFSAYAKQGLDKDGKFTREALQPLAEVNVKSLSEFRYFTRLKHAGKVVEHGLPENYWIDHDDKTGTLILNFSLPLKTAIAPGAEGFVVQIADPEYFVAFELDKKDAVSLINAPAACKSHTKGPDALDDATVAQLSRLPSTVRQLPSALSGLTQSLSNDLIVRCP